MSNLSRLQVVSSSLDTAIQKVNNLPDAGGSGGGSVETCNVYLLMGAIADGRFAVYTTLDTSGNMTPAVLENCGSAVTPLVCVCDTPLILFRNDQWGLSFDMQSDLSVLRSNPSQGLYVFAGGTEANTDYWIRFMPGDEAGGSN